MKQIVRNYASLYVIDVLTFIFMNYHVGYYFYRYDFFVKDAVIYRLLLLFNDKNSVVRPIPSNSRLKNIESNLSDEDFQFSDHDSESEGEAGNGYESDSSDSDCESIFDYNGFNFWKTMSLKTTPQNNIVNILMAIGMKNVSSLLQYFTKYIAIDMVDRIVYV